MQCSYRALGVLSKHLHEVQRTPCISGPIPYGGAPLRIGAESESVRVLQQYLNYIADTYPEIPTVDPTGYFGPRTQEAVIAFQNLAGIEPTGVVAAVTWTEIAELYTALSRGAELQEGQFPGFPVGR